MILTAQFLRSKYTETDIQRRSKSAWKDKGETTPKYVDEAVTRMF